jgi:uncharacterized protein YdhG (YjbR/CyaY superfamily)
MELKITFTTIDEYISSQPENIRPLLEILRKAIKEAAPLSRETISYGMPAFKIHGILVYFAANKNHIGLYPTASPIVFFKDELANYKTSKGAIQFPITNGIPVKLVQKIVEYRVVEDDLKMTSKKGKKK